MDKEEIKEKCDFNKIREITFTNIGNEELKADYIVNDKGEGIIPISPLEYKLIEKIKDLESRITELEIKVVTK